MRVEHYAYFSIASHVLTGEEIADRVGLPGDEIVVKGSRRADPPVPVDHAWKIYADPREPYLFVQVEELLDRVASVEDPIAALLEEHGDQIGCVLRLIRKYDTAEGWKSEDALGVVFTKDHVALLARLGALIDVDEYDYGIEDVEPLGMAGNRRLWLAPHRDFRWAADLKDHFHLPTEIGPFTLLLALSGRHADDELKELAGVLREQGLVFLCAWRPDGERVHDLFDAVRDRERPDLPFLMTARLRDSLADAVRFAISGSAPDVESEHMPIRSVIAATDRSDWHEELRGLFEAHTESTPR